MLDDDPALVRMAELALTIEGFRVSTAGDGLAGLACLEAQSFDAIVLDLQMPRMDGRTFLRTIRERGINTPVVIVSAYEPGQARAQLDAEAFIKKPFEPEMLVEVVVTLTAAPSP
jgi:CheY-like chemotaxis protein